MEHDQAALWPKVSAGCWRGAVSQVATVATCAVQMGPAPIHHPGSGQQITRQKSQKRNSIGKCHWNSIEQIQYKSTGKVAILWTMPVTSEIMLENTTDNALENTTDNPR